MKDLWAEKSGAHLYSVSEHSYNPLEVYTIIKTCYHLHDLIDKLIDLENEEFNEDDEL
jgi:hypothetical protein